MSDYIRTTRECSVRQLQPELFQAIQSHFQEHRLGVLEAEALLCCETTSKKKSTAKIASWLNGGLDTTIYTGMLLTSEWLIWVHHGDQSGTRLNSANLKQIRAEFYNSPLTKDTGLEIYGYISGSEAPIRGYIGMGPGPAAEKFCDEVIQAVAKRKPPRKKGMFTWLTGG